MTTPSTSTYKRTDTIPFMSTLGAGLQQTYVSSRIPYRFRIVHTSIVFSFGTGNNLLIYVLASRTTTTSTSTVPPDTPVFSQYSPSPYFVGEGLIKCPPVDFHGELDEAYVKVHAINNSAIAQTVNVTVTVCEA
jgi:hypothetical protein